MATLSKQARETIKWYWFGETAREHTTIAGYTRHFFGDQGWQGDSCGCIDFRCIGFHHNETSECHCLPNSPTLSWSRSPPQSWPTARCGG